MMNQIEALEAIAGVMGYGFETSNKYKIKNSLGQVGLIVTHFFNSDQSSWEKNMHCMGCFL